MAGFPFQKRDRKGLPDFIDKISEHPHLMIVHLKGDLDFKVVPEVTAYLDGDSHGQRLTDKSVLFDLRKVEKVDSAVIAQLIVVLSKLKRKNFKLGLMNVPDRLQSIVEILKLEEILTVFHSRNAALQEILAWSEDWK